MAGKLPIYVVEAFTAGNNQPFTGNTAAICVLGFDDEIPDDLKQKIGLEMNLSETAFISQGWTKLDPLNSYSSNRWTLRWFTPTVEVELCGHATLASANVIFNEIIKKNSLVKSTAGQEDEPETTIIFESKFKGQLHATMNWATGKITLNFPSNPTIPLESAPGIESKSWVQNMVAETLGPNIPVDAVDDIQFAPGLRYIVFRLKDTGSPETNLQLLGKVQPNFMQLLEIKTSNLKMHSVTVTVQGWAPECQSQGQPQFFSRFFAPWSGVNEDPVTGSAHTTLAPYWIQEWTRQGVNLEVTVGGSVLGRQVSARTGDVLCSLRDGGERVNLVGQSRLTLKGEFYP